MGLFNWLFGSAADSQPSSKHAKVYVWNPKNSDEVGHASMHLEDLTYISFWPHGEAGKKDAVWLTSRPPAYKDSYDEDCYAFKNRKADEIIVIQPIDTDSIRERWREIRTDSKAYQLKTFNCSTVVADCLYAGSQREPSFIPCVPVLGVKFQAWTPQAVAQYARELANETA